MNQSEKLLASSMLTLMTEYVRQFGVPAGASLLRASAELAVGTADLVTRTVLQKYVPACQEFDKQMGELLDANIARLKATESN